MQLCITSLVVAQNIATYFKQAIAIAIACAQADMSTLPSEPASDLDSRAIPTWTLQGSLLAGSTVSSNSFNPFELSTLSTKLAFQATSISARSSEVPNLSAGLLMLRDYASILRFQKHVASI